jgi:hypothetical protein
MKLKVSFAAIVSMLIALPALAEEPDREPTMPIPAPKPQLEQDKKARLFIETLEKTGQLVDVDEQQDTSQLPARVTTRPLSCACRKLKPAHIDSAIRPEWA